LWREIKRKLKIKPQSPSPRRGFFCGEKEYMSATPESAQLQADIQKKLQEHYNTQGNKTFIRNSDLSRIFRENPDNHVEFYRALAQVFTKPLLATTVVLGLTGLVSEAELFIAVNSGEVTSNEQLTQRRESHYTYTPKRSKAQTAE
jgi:hypothetical protein